MDFYKVLIVLIVAGVVLILAGIISLFKGYFFRELVSGTFLFILGTAVLLFAIVLICCSANLTVTTLF